MQETTRRCCDSNWIMLDLDCLVDIREVVKGKVCKAYQKGPQSRMMRLLACSLRMMCDEFLKPSWGKNQGLLSFWLIKVGPSWSPVCAIEMRFLRRACGWMQWKKRITHLEYHQYHTSHKQRGTLTSWCGLVFQVVHQKSESSPTLTYQGWSRQMYLEVLQDD